MHVWKISRQNFSCLNFRGFYFRVSVVGHENRENLDLAKISRYTVCENVFLWPKKLFCLEA